MQSVEAISERTLYWLSLNDRIPTLSSKRPEIGLLYQHSGAGAG